MSEDYFGTDETGTMFQCHECKELLFSEETREDICKKFPKFDGEKLPDGQFAYCSKCGETE